MTRTPQPVTFSETLTGTGSSPHPNTCGVTFQSAAGDVFSFNDHASGAPALNTMFIYVSSTIRSVVPYSYSGYNGTQFCVKYANGDGPYCGNFTDGNVNF